MSDQITYDDKADLIVDTTIDDIFKVSASDMNEIKNVVNSHADDIDVANNNITDLNNNKLDKNEVLNGASTDTDKPYSADYLNDKLVNVGTTAPTDGRRVWFRKGVNLYNGSQDFSGVWVNSDGWATASETYNGLVVKKSSNQWNGLYKEIQLKSGKKYVFSAYVKSDVSRNVAIYLTGGTGACNPQSQQNIQITNEWQRISLVFSTTNNGLFRARVENMTNEGAGSYTYVCGYQLEEGSIATSYEPYVEPSINVDEEEWYSKPKVLWSGKATSVDIDLRGYSFIEVIFCSNDNFYNSLKVPVSGSTFSRALALCNSYLSDPMGSSGSLYLKYGKATLTQSGITIKSNVEVAITNTASQIRWQGATNTLLYITTIIGYK